MSENRIKEIEEKILPRLERRLEQIAPPPLSTSKQTNLQNTISQYETELTNLRRDSSGRGGEGDEVIEER